MDNFLSELNQLDIKEGGFREIITDH